MVWQAILTRVNSLSHLEYRDDPTIFGWELINEPQCCRDSSGDTLQVNLENFSFQVKRGVHWFGMAQLRLTFYTLLKKKTCKTVQKMVYGVANQLAIPITCPEGFKTSY